MAVLCTNFGAYTVCDLPVVQNSDCTFIALSRDFRDNCRFTGFFAGNRAGLFHLLILTAANAVADMEIVRIRTSTSANNRFLLFFILSLLYNKQCRSVSPDLQIDYNTYGRNAPHTKG